MNKRDFEVDIKIINRILEKYYTKKDILFLEEIDDRYLSDIKRDVEDYKNGRPIEYIVWKASFYGREYKVDERVLIPRDETELLVWLVEKEKLWEKYDILIDIWVWSGAIVCSVCQDIDIVYGVDISQGAIDVAQENVGSFGLEIKFLISDLLEYFEDRKEIFEDKNIIITANLPYIKEWDYEAMDKSVIEYEPDSALYGGCETGFELYEKLITQIIDIKIKSRVKNIVGFIEIWYNQVGIAKKFLEKKEIQNFETYKDMSNIDRVLKIYF